MKAKDILYELVKAIIPAVVVYLPSWGMFLLTGHKPLWEAFLATLATLVLTTIVETRLLYALAMRRFKSPWQAMWDVSRTPFSNMKEASDEGLLRRTSSR